MTRDTMQVAFCCRENPCGVLVATLTSCCLEKPIVYNVCQIPDTICALTDDGPIILVGDIDGVSACWEFDCKVIDYVCGEDEPAVEGNCCPENKDVEYVEWAAISINLGPGQEGSTCVTCCDDDDPPCGPFGPTFSFSYICRSYTTLLATHYNDAGYCYGTCSNANGSPFQEWSNATSVARTPTFQNCTLQGVGSNICCASDGCGASFNTGGFGFAAPPPQPVCSQSQLCPECYPDPELFSDDCKGFKVLASGPRASYFGEWDASFTGERYVCEWDDGTQEGYAYYTVDGPFTKSYFRWTAGNNGTGNWTDTAPAPCCQTPPVLTPTWARGQVVPEETIQGRWYGVHSQNGSSTTMRAVFYSLDADGGIVSPPIFDYTLSHNSATNRIAAAFDPGGGDDSYDYGGYGRCGPATQIGEQVFGPCWGGYTPANLPGQLYYRPHPTALQNIRVGTSVTSYPQNQWVLSAPLSDGTPSSEYTCGEFIGAGGLIFQASMST